MPQFRKKPIVVEAEQWFPDKALPGVYWEPETRDDGEKIIPYVVTIHGQRAYLAAGDWIIVESDAKHHYPCKPDVFAATYEPV